jgi:hypothetical protein
MGANGKTLLQPALDRLEVIMQIPGHDYVCPCGAGDGEFKEHFTAAHLEKVLKIRGKRRSNNTVNSRIKREIVPPEVTSNSHQIQECKYRLRF